MAIAYIVKELQTKDATSSFQAPPHTNFLF